VTDGSTEIEAKPFEAVRVLVAESDTVALESAQSLMRHFGCAVDVAKDGVEAVRLTQMNRYGIVFIGSGLTGLDSCDVARKIREYEDLREKGTRVPIIALMAAPADDECNACYAAGMDGWLGKPFTADSLRMVLERWAFRTARLCAAASVNRRTAPTMRTVAAVEARAKTSPIERTTLESIRALATPHRPDVLREVIEVYLASAEQHLRDLAEAACSNDVLTMIKAANALKSSSANVGAVTLAAFCRELASLDGGMENTRSYCEQIAEEFGRVRTALESEVRSA
jgi:CheY-like chemotaxis protein